MDFVHLVILGLVQGITEFLPISSSAHLILMPQVMGWQDQGLVNDVAAHVGSLVAVVVYFRRDIRAIMVPWVTSSAGDNSNTEKQLLICLVIGTLPIMLVGYLLYDFVSEYFRNPVIIAIASIVFGLVLWWSDRAGKQSRSMSELTTRDAIMVGLAQAVALIPGTSRSGITMTAGLFLGMERQVAARFSFLLSIPVIILAGGHEAWRFFMLENNTDWTVFFTVALVSGISAWITIYYFLKFLQKTGMLPYVIYRVVLGVVLLLVFA